MHDTIYRAGLGLYVVWLLLVVLLLLGRYTPAPLFGFVQPGVVVGAAVLTVFGAGRLVRSGYRRVGD
ncbi:hypothetical protein [Haloarchaeobius baliensis]|uniref:hypothetical protein n=1 Tax=Haloarchaeobius baliensis TaxID=1670458 RepID=UPI003F8817C5